MDFFEERRADIAPTNADLLKMNDPASAQEKAYDWLQSDPITQTPGRRSRNVLEQDALVVYVPLLRSRTTLEQRM